MKVLIAEDSIDDQYLLSCAFNVDGDMNDVELEFVQDGREALDWLLHRGDYDHREGEPPPGLVILDLNMPRMDGHQVLEELALYPELASVPVVVFTSSSSIFDVRRSEGLEARAFVTKPSEFDGLVSFLNRVCSYYREAARSPARENQRLDVQVLRMGGVGQGFAHRF